MYRMQSPNPNRKGEYEVHDVPSRKVARLRAAGWHDVDSGAATANDPDTERSAPTFDMTGTWLSVRARVRDAVGADHVPSGKEEARQWLRDVGYEVIG